MKIEILSRWSSAVKFTFEYDGEDHRIGLGLAVKAALEQEVSLTGAVLRGAVLTGADLRGADLRGADLTDAVLTDAVLTGADLRGADLRGADLTDAVLRGADLTDADLTGADLTGFRDDLWAVLSSAPGEAQAVLDALCAGKVDGSCYTGECACLVGTIANARHCTVNDIPTLRPNSSRPAEVWFMQIKPGNTPENHKPTQLAAEWVAEWIDRMRGAFGPPPPVDAPSDQAAA